MAAPDPETSRAPDRAPVRVLRIIARLNIGGPAIHTVLLTEGLQDREFHSVLVTGLPGEHEGDMSYLAHDRGIDWRVMPVLRRELSWWSDLAAFWSLWRLMRRFRPRIVHTHTAKAGTVGRLAAIAAGVPLRVHTFHGHVFHGYFGRFKTGMFLQIERALARFTHRIVAISELQRHDLCDVYRVVPRSRCTVIPLGFDLRGFAAAERRRGELRRELRVPEGRPLIGIVGRLVPIKNHGMFLEMAERVVRARDAGFVIVGDGELRAELERSVRERGLVERVAFLGWRRDLDVVYADLDVVALTSLNEGTPVALIEALAAARPVVATRVGGVANVVEHERTGLLVDSGDVEGLTHAVLRMLSEPALGERLAREGRERAIARYGSERLVGDVRQLYRELLARAGRAIDPVAPNP